MDRGSRGVQVTKSISLREVRNNLSAVIEDLDSTGPVIITKNGKSRALLLPVDENTDLESLLLSTNRRFWDLFDKAAKTRKWTPLENL